MNKNETKLPKCHLCREMCIKNYISHYSFAVCHKCRKIITRWLEIEIWVNNETKGKRPKGKIY